MILFALEIIIGVLLVTAIVLQNQGSGLSSSFGGGSGEFYRSKRSIEKMLIWCTGILATLFSVVSVLLLLNH